MLDLYRLRTGVQLLPLGLLGPHMCQENPRLQLWNSNWKRSSLRVWHQDLDLLLQSVTLAKMKFAHRRKEWGQRRAVCIDAPLLPQP
jgi:hypothetical protein